MPQVGCFCSSWKLQKNGFYLQLDLNLERLRMAIEDLLVKLAKMFSKPKLQTIFLINNYDLTIAILKVTIF
jgi:hypothetical protein